MTATPVAYRARIATTSVWIAAFLTLALASSLLVIATASSSDAAAAEAHAPIDEPGPIPGDAARWFRIGQIKTGAAFATQLALIDRAVAAGYNGVLIADGSPNTKVRDPNLQEFVRRANDFGLATVMTVVPFGYCAGATGANDPSLQAG